MAPLLLILTNPYAYKTALNQALTQAQSPNSPLKVVFAIDPDSLDDLMRDLGESGWLGIGSRRSLQASMLEGYRVLARDILDEVNRRSAEVGTKVETEVKEAPLQSYIRSVRKQGFDNIIVSGSQSLTPFIEKMDPPVEWIPED